MTETAQQAPAEAVTGMADRVARVPTRVAGRTVWDGAPVDVGERGCTPRRAICRVAGPLLGHVVEWGAWLVGEEWFLGHRLLARVAGRTVWDGASVEVGERGCTPRRAICRVAGAFLGHVVEWGAWLVGQEPLPGHQHGSAAMTEAGRVPFTRQDLGARPAVAASDRPGSGRPDPGGSPRRARRGAAPRLARRRRDLARTRPAPQGIDVPRRLGGRPVVTAFAELHHAEEPLLLPNAWDHASAFALAARGLAAIGTTSLGVAASAGLPDGAAQTREETLRLALALGKEPFLLSVDAEGGVSEDPDEVGEFARDCPCSGP